MSVEVQLAELRVLHNDMRRSFADVLNQYHTMTLLMSGAMNISDVPDLMFDGVLLNISCIVEQYHLHGEVDFELDFELNSDEEITE